MWYSKCSWTLVVLVALFALVSGSCLEYGHSCWGAHGKRSGGKAEIDAKQHPGPNSFAIDSVAEQLYNSNNNQNNPDDTNDEDSNTIANTNSAVNIPLAAPVLLPRREPEDRPGMAKWTQLMRQHRYQLRQLQDQQQQGRGRGGQYDAAAESWRKLQQALQAQIDADNENTVYELTK
nr:LOW QUALITY PROTEIN: neuropeptide CCHamide-1 [Drosophila suzukii]